MHVSTWVFVFLERGRDDRGDIGESQTNAKTALLSLL